MLIVWNVREMEGGNERFQKMFSSNSDLLWRDDDDDVKNPENLDLYIIPTAYLVCSNLLIQWVLVSLLKAFIIISENRRRCWRLRYNTMTLTHRDNLCCRSLWINMLTASYLGVHAHISRHISRWCLGKESVGGYMNYYIKLSYNN